MALVPPGVVTVTSTIPAPCAGLVAVIEFAVSALMVAATPPKLTAVAPFKFVPVMVHCRAAGGDSGGRRNCGDSRWSKVSEIIGSTGSAHST